MPLREKHKDSAFDVKAYMNEYVKEKIIYKRVHFTKANQDDMELLEWIEAQAEGTAPYIKRLIRADMEAREPKEP